MVNIKIKLIIFFAQEDGEALYGQQKTRPGTDCGSDHKLLTAKFRLKLKKVGTTTRPFRYDLNHTPDDYTVEVRNRFRGETWETACLRNDARRLIHATGVHFRSHQSLSCV